MSRRCSRETHDALWESYGRPFRPGGHVSHRGGAVGHPWRGIGRKLYNGFGEIG